MIDIIIVLVIFAVGLMMYKELNKETVIIDPFQVPMDLEKMNITGQAVVNKLLDEIEDIKAHADTAYKQLDFKPVFYDTQLEIVIPGSGVSLKSLLQNVKSFLGKKQTHISGEIVLNKKLYLTIRVQGEPSKTFSGELEDLDNLLAQAAQYVLKYTQPYILAYYLYYNYYGRDKNEALDMIQYTLTHDPKDDDAMAYTLNGYIKWDEGKFDESIKFYKKAIELNPKYVDAYDGWGYSLYDQKKYDEADAIYRKAVSIDPMKNYTYHYWGLNLEAQNKIDSSIEMYKKAIQLDPNYFDVYPDYGNILLKQKKYMEAQEMYNKAIELNPKSALAYTGLGNVFYEQKKYDEAMEMFNKAISADIGYVDAFIGAGNIFKYKNNPEASNLMYKKAIFHDSLGTAAYNKLGLNLEEQKKYESAIEVYQKAVKKGTPDSTYFLMRIEELKKIKF